MIITRTPFRVSFFGGGTDYHTWYQEHGGAALSTSINHYCYLTCRNLPPFFKHNSRVVWSKIEEIKDHIEVEHPVVNAVLKYLNIDQGVEIHHQGDLPAHSGLGSSSSFTVGLLNALYAMQGIMSTKKQLACEAVHVEREILKENVGVQDQIATAYGGFNKIDIQKNGQFNVQPVVLPQKRLEELQSHLMLFFTGISRISSQVAGEQMKAIPKKQMELHHMHMMVEEAVDILSQGKDICDFGRLLDESWSLKRSLSNKISPELVDEVYEAAKQAGAYGGKLLGAGGGGFILLFAKPEDQPQVMKALSSLLLVPFQFETAGSQIIFCDKPSYTESGLARRNFVHLEKQNKNVTKAHLQKLQENRKSSLTVL